MEHFKWAAVPVSALGLIFLFFGIIWQGAVQLAIAAVIWRTATGTWPLAASSL